jgi:putative iron-dependent peroxidase
LDFSRAITGNLFFAPSLTFLEGVTTDQPAGAAGPSGAEAPQPASPLADGSLGIGSLKGGLRHE